MLRASKGWERRIWTGGARFNLLVEARASFLRVGSLAVVQQVRRGLWHFLGLLGQGGKGGRIVLAVPNKNSVHVRNSASTSHILHFEEPTPLMTDLFETKERCECRERRTGKKPNQLLIDEYTRNLVLVERTERSQSSDIIDCRGERFLDNGRWARNDQ